ncbi:hypothetical protein BDB01DRAFT_895372 [Pilobolus umbonatus]|nr:hypothetical protein BDB01DRAFT_895372 [Pilobolus umbonatus]
MALFLVIEMKKNSHVPAFTSISSVTHLVTTAGFKMFSPVLNFGRENHKSDTISKSEWINNFALISPSHFDIRTSKLENRGTSPGTDSVTSSEEELPDNISNGNPFMLSKHKESLEKTKLMNRAASNFSVVAIVVSENKADTCILDTERKYVKSNSCTPALAFGVPLDPSEDRTPSTIIASHILSILSDEKLSETAFSYLISEKNSTVPLFISGTPSYFAER